MSKNFKPQITLFHCINTIKEADCLSLIGTGGFAIHSVKLPCSGMVKEVFLLRAFEAQADAVVVLVCPDGECRHVDGNKRTRNRVERVKSLLDEIGLDGRRLSIFALAGGDEAAAAEIIQRTVAGLADLGPNPAT
ncbi:MAG: hydrogenase iron-sulfur subunit [Syntrophobacteria bacterium]